MSIKQHSQKKVTSSRPADKGIETSTQTDRTVRVGAYVTANTATPEAARTKLKELGIMGSNGKLSKQYR
jgi:hypothetical protein